MKTVKRYKHIFFDLDNTIWDFKRNSFFAMQAAFKTLDISKQNIDFNVFFEAYNVHNHHLWDEYRKSRVTKNELTYKRFQLTFDELGVNNIDPQNMNEIYLMEMPIQTNLIDGALDVLQYLKNRQYRLHVITNGFAEVQTQKIETSGLKSFFDKIYISEIIKSPKPDYRIFEFAVKSSNARKKESLMIGDDWDVDVLGAADFGIDAVYYNPSNNMHYEENKKRLKAGYIYNIERLEQLKNIL